MPTRPTAAKAANGDPLRVFTVSEKEFFVESSKEKILYKVFRHNGTATCTCGDYTANVKKEAGYQCKHILAVLRGPAETLAEQTPKPKLHDEFIISIQGTEFVKYAGLLDLAHQKGIQMIQVDPVQYPTADNGYEAICKATVESSDRALYVEYGDASPKNVNRKVANHILRMAATRAKARCLRDFTNIGITCLEELGGDDDIIPADSAASPVSPKATGAESADKVIPMKKTGATSAQTNASDKSLSADKKHVANNGKPSAAQKNAIENLAQRRGLEKKDLDDIAQKLVGANYEDLSASDAAQFIQALQQSG